MHLEIHNDHQLYGVLSDTASPHLLGDPVLLWAERVQGEHAWVEVNQWARHVHGTTTMTRDSQEMRMVRTHLKQDMWYARSSQPRSLPPEMASDLITQLVYRGSSWRPPYLRDCYYSTASHLHALGQDELARAAGTGAVLPVAGENIGTLRHQRLLDLNKITWEHWVFYACCFSPASDLSPSA